MLRFLNRLGCRRLFLKEEEAHHLISSQKETIPLNEAVQKIYFELICTASILEAILDDVPQHSPPGPLNELYPRSSGQQNSEDDFSVVSDNDQVTVA